MAVIISFRTGKPTVSDVSTQEPLKSVPSTRKRGNAGQENRKYMLAKVHVAKKQLGMTDEDYRALLNGLFEANSAAVLTVLQLHELLQNMCKAGFRPTKGSAPAKATRKKVIPATLQPDADDPLGRKPYMQKIEAQLADKGRVEGTHIPWGYAVAILKRQSNGVTRCFEHATVEQLRNVIAALSRDARRKGRQ